MARLRYAFAHTQHTHTHSPSVIMAWLIIKRWVCAAGILVFALLEHSHIFPPGSIGSPPYARGFCANNMYKYVLEYNTSSYMRIYAHVCLSSMCMCVCILCNAQVIVRILINSLCSRHTSWGTVRQDYVPRDFVIRVLKFVIKFLVFPHILMEFGNWHYRRLNVTFILL